MLQVNTEDITVPWGQTPDPSEQQYGRYRMALFQDMQESADGNKLYFLYDPQSDNECITTSGARGNTSLVVFDTYRKCFVAEIPVYVQGRVKFLFGVNNGNKGPGTSFVLVTQEDTHQARVLHFWRIVMSQDGLQMAQGPFPLLRAPVNLQPEQDFICSMRDDVPELILVHGPGLIIYRIAADAPSSTDILERFEVPNADISHFYDAFLDHGNYYFLSASPDGHLDYTRIHVLPLNTRQLSTQYCTADPQRGMPPARLQAGLDAFAGFIILAGGEIAYGNDVTRLVDYWVLDLNTFRWNQVPSQMPIPLIEPRVTVGNTGAVYLWGDFDQPLPGMPSSGTHLRVLRVRGLNNLQPPSYDQAVNYSGPAPSYNDHSGQGQNTPYPQGPHGQNTPYPEGPQGGLGYPQSDYGGAPQGGYNDAPQGGYGGPPPSSYGGPPTSSYGDAPAGSYGGPPQGSYGGPQGGYDSTPQAPMYPHYPPQSKKKDCVIC